MAKRPPARSWQALLIAALAVAAGCSGAGGRAEREAAVMDLPSLVAALEAQGLEVAEGQRVEQPFLSAPGRTLRIHGEDVLAFEYRDAAARAADSEKISPDAERSARRWSAGSRRRGSGPRGASWSSTSAPIKR